jgi:hypothetical protein
MYISRSFVIRVTLTLLGLLSSTGLMAQTLHDTLVTQRPDGLLVINAPEVPKDQNNPWPAEEEERYIRQYNRYLEKIKNTRIKPNTYFENEKKWYGDAMLKYIATGDPQSLEALQSQDHQHQVWHKETNGIDYYACFTIKHQVRKYFQFGDGLDPAYKTQMFEGAKKWTAQDPLGREHYAFLPAKKNQGWGPDAKNSWVDVRTTDNLLWMRNVAVYLMAEETGNTETARIYKERIQKFVVALYRVGTGEWDSHNYLSHTIAPLHSLYDFAKDPEVRALAKAALDHYYTAAAIKYRNGNWNGPDKRDYNAISPMTASPGIFSVMFGNNPVLNHADYDSVHIIGSAYRPPMAVLALARKEDLAGTEVFIQHAPYSSPMQGNYKTNPAYYETQYFGNSFQLGSLARGTQESDVNGFKIIADDSETGAELLQLVPGSDPLFPGSPQYQSGKLAGRGRVAQYQNLAIYLVRGNQTPWTWVIPNKTQVELQNDILFLRHENTWVAYRGIQTTFQGLDEKKTERLHINIKRVKLSKNQIKNPPDWVVPGSEEVDKSGRVFAKRNESRYPDYKALTATGPRNGWGGLVIEIGEPQTHKTYEEFKQAILSKASLDQTNLDTGIVSYKSSQDKTLEIRAQDPLTNEPVLRDGQVRSYVAPWFKYQNADASKTAPVQQKWTGDTLTVEAGGYRFSSTVTEDGTVTFSNQSD